MLGGRVAMVEGAELGEALAEKVAPEAATAVKSLVGKMLGANLGADEASAMFHALPSSTADLFRAEWLQQSKEHTVRAAVPSLDEFTSLINESPTMQAIKGTTVTARGLGTYTDMLRLSKNELTGNVLDVGSGSWQQLAYESRLRGLPMNVTSVDPRLGLGLKRDLADMGDNVPQRILGRLFPEKQTIAATADKLPFADNSFDRAFALYSTSRYRTGLGQIMSDLGEMQRVVRPGGEVRIYPIWEEHASRFDTAAKALRANVSWLEDKPTTFPDFEAGRPAGVVDRVMILHK